MKLSQILTHSHFLPCVFLSQDCAYEAESKTEMEIEAWRGGMFRLGYGR